MTGSAIALMLVAIIVIWGGLLTASISLMLRGRRDKKAAKAAAEAARSAKE